MIMVKFLLLDIVPFITVFPSFLIAKCISPNDGISLEGGVSALSVDYEGISIEYSVESLRPFEVSDGHQCVYEHSANRLSCENDKNPHAFYPSIDVSSETELFSEIICDPEYKPTRNEMKKYNLVHIHKAAEFVHLTVNGQNGSKEYLKIPSSLTKIQLPRGGLMLQISAQHVEKTIHQGWYSFSVSDDGIKNGLMNIKTLQDVKWTSVHYDKNNSNYATNSSQHSCLKINLPRNGSTCYSKNTNCTLNVIHYSWKNEVFNLYPLLGESVRGVYMLAKESGIIFNFIKNPAEVCLTRITPEKDSFAFKSYIKVNLLLGSKYLFISFENIQSRRESQYEVQFIDVTNDKHVFHFTTSKNTSLYRFQVDEKIFNDTWICLKSLTLLKDNLCILARYNPYNKSTHRYNSVQHANITSENIGKRANITNKVSTNVLQRVQSGGNIKIFPDKTNSFKKNNTTNNDERNHLIKNYDTKDNITNTDNRSSVKSLKHSGDSDIRKSQIITDRLPFSPTALVAIGILLSFLLLAAFITLFYWIRFLRNPVPPTRQKTTTPVIVPLMRQYFYYEHTFKGEDYVEKRVISQYKSS